MNRKLVAALCAVVAVASLGIGVAVGAQSSLAPPIGVTYKVPRVAFSIHQGPATSIRWRLDFESRTVFKNLVPWTNSTEVSFGPSQGAPAQGVQHTYGLTIEIDGHATRYLFRGARDVAGKAVLTYSSEIQGFFVAPDEGNTISFIGGTATTAKDTPFVDRLTASGYTVIRYDDNAVTAAQLNDTTVVISSSVSPNVLRPLVSVIYEPIVTWEPYLAFQMGLTTQQYANGAETGREAAADWPAGSPPYLTAVTMTNHDPFGWITGQLGDLIYGENGDIWLIRPIVPSADPSQNGPWSVIDMRYLKNALPTAQKGTGLATVVDGGYRILLPWTYQTQDRLSQDGWELFDRAVESATNPH